jgi:hypothetical protein
MIFHVSEAMLSGSWWEPADWCEDNLGPYGERWRTTFNGESDSINFYSIPDFTDATIFRMTWSDAIVHIAEAHPYYDGD